MKMCLHKVVVSLSNMRILCILPQLLFPELSRFFNLASSWVKRTIYPVVLHLHKFISFLSKIYITLIYHSYIVHALVLTHLINYDHTHLTEKIFKSNYEPPQTKQLILNQTIAYNCWGGSLFLLSLSQVIASITFWWFFIKRHIPVK